MRYSPLVAAGALALAGFSNGLNILMNNDDGFGSGNLRELYKLLKAKGHDGKPTALPSLPLCSSTKLTEGWKKSGSSHQRPKRAGRAAAPFSPTRPT